MMALADLGLYAVILAHIGPVGWPTTNLNFNFMEEAVAAAPDRGVPPAEAGASRSARRRSIPREATISFATRRETIRFPRRIPPQWPLGSRPL